MIFKRVTHSFNALSLLTNTIDLFKTILFISGILITRVKYLFYFNSLSYAMF